jgi:hypothetical protein
MVSCLPPEAGVLQQGESMRQKWTEEELEEGIRALIYLLGDIPPEDADIEELQVLLKEEIKCGADLKRLKMLRIPDFLELVGRYGCLSDVNEATFGEVKEVWEEIGAQR